MKNRPLVVCFLLMVLCIAFGKAAGRQSRTQPLPEGLEGEEVTLQGTVYKREYGSEKNLIYLKDLSVGSENLELSTNAIIYTKENGSFRIGSRIKVKGILYAPEAPGNPGQFDQEAYYGARKVGIFLKKGELLGESADYGRFLEALAVLRENLRSRLALALNSLGEDRDAGVLSAMLLGEKSLLDDQTETLYQSGGISHILAISGLHISLAGMALYNVCRIIFGGFWIPAAVSGLVMVFYGWFTGGSISTLRAVVMFLVFLGAQVCGREYDRWSAWALGGIMILVWEPMQLFQCGFQLSMLSVAGVEVSLMLAAFEGVDGKADRSDANLGSGTGNGAAQAAPGGKVGNGAARAAPGGQNGCRKSLPAFLRGIPGRLWKKLAPGVLIQAFTLPCTLYWFSEVSPYGLLLNLVVLPLMPVVLLSGAAGMLGACLAAKPGIFLLAPAHYVLEFYEMLCRGVQELPFGKVICGAPSMAASAVYYAGLLLLLAAHGRKAGSELRIETVSGGTGQGRGAGNAVPCRTQGRGGGGAVPCRAQNGEADNVVSGRMQGRGAGNAVPCRTQGRGAGNAVPGRAQVRRRGLLNAAGGLGLLLGLLCFFYPAVTNGGDLWTDLFTGLTGSRGELTMTFLDVGQGDCIFIRAPEGVVWLIDGGSSTESSVGKYRILPFLKNQGVSRVDYAVTTHMDADHINGLRELLSDPGGVDIGCLVMNQTAFEDEQGAELLALAEKAGVSAVEMHQGQGFGCGALMLSCLWPEENSSYSDKNENSLVFLVSFGEFSALLTGDLEGNAEGSLTGSGTLTDVWLLKAGHHGSKGATSAVFLAETKPELAVLSYGKDNRYGHPSPEMLERLEDAGVKYLGTAEAGAVTVRTDGTRVRVNTFRTQ